MSELGFYRIANSDPDKLALVEPSEKTWTRGELLAKANQLTHALRALGVSKGDVVATVLPNSVDYYVSYLACAQAGFYMVPINWHLAGPEIAYILEDSGAKAFIASGSVPAMEEACLKAVSAINFPTSGCISTTPIEGFISLDNFLADHPTSNPEDRTAGQVMNYTSGTTGKPKGVRRNLVEGDPDDILSMFAMILSFFDIQPGENNVHIVGSPLYHTAVLVHSTAALHYGHSVVLMEKFDAEKMLYLIDKFRVTTSHMVPTQFHRLLQLPEDIRSKYDCSSTRAMIHAAAPCPVHTKKDMISWWGNSIWEYYAATEGGGTVVDAKSWSEFPGTVGQAWPGAEIKIINDQVYFTVGDIGYLNKEGYLFLCDRKIDMIISGGANIYPAEIESVLLMHPQVADAAVFGIPNEEWGEEVKAVIELIAGVESSNQMSVDLMAFAQENLAKMKLPRSIDFMKKLPRDENGKLYKRKLRDPYWENHVAKV